MRVSKDWKKVWKKRLKKRLKKWLKKRLKKRLKKDWKKFNLFFNLFVHFSIWPRERQHWNSIPCWCSTHFLWWKKRLKKRLEKRLKFLSIFFSIFFSIIFSIFFPIFFSIFFSIFIHGRSSYLFVFWNIILTHIFWMRSKGQSIYDNVTIMVALKDQMDTYNLLKIWMTWHLRMIQSGCVQKINWVFYSKLRPFINDKFLNS